MLGFGKTAVLEAPSDGLVNVEDCARIMNLHPRQVRRYAERLPAEDRTPDGTRPLRVRIEAIERLRGQPDSEETVSLEQLFVELEELPVRIQQAKAAGDAVKLSALQARAQCLPSIMAMKLQELLIPEMEAARLVQSWEARAATRQDGARIAAAEAAKEAARREMGFAQAEVMDSASRRSTILRICNEQEDLRQRAIAILDQPDAERAKAAALSLLRDWSERKAIPTIEAIQAKRQQRREENARTLQTILQTYTVQPDRIPDALRGDLVSHLSGPERREVV